VTLNHFVLCTLPVNSRISPCFLQVRPLVIGSLQYKSRRAVYDCLVVTVVNIVVHLRTLFLYFFLGFSYPNVLEEIGDTSVKHK